MRSKDISDNNIEIIRLAPGDEERAGLLINSVKPARERVNSDVSSNYLSNFLKNNANVLIGAFINSEPAGFAIGYALQRIDGRKSMLYLHEIEVLEQFRRLGLGKKIISKLQKICALNGYGELFLITEKTNTIAMNFYESMGLKAITNNSIVFSHDIQ